MNVLSVKELGLLLELVKNEKESIHQEAIQDKELRERELDIDFIIIRLETKIKTRNNKLDYLIKKIEVKEY